MKINKTHDTTTYAKNNEGKPNIRHPNNEEGPGNELPNCLVFHGHIQYKQDHWTRIISIMITRNGFSSAVPFKYPYVMCE